MSSFFIDEKLKRKFEKDVQKRAQLEKKESKHIKEFMGTIPYQNLKEFLDVLKSKCYPHDAKRLEDIYAKIESSLLSPNDILELLDLYETYATTVRE